MKLSKISRRRQFKKTKTKKTKFSEKFGETFQSFESQSVQKKVRIKMIRTFLQINRSSKFYFTVTFRSFIDPTKDPVSPPM